MPAIPPAQHNTSIRPPIPRPIQRRLLSRSRGGTANGGATPGPGGGGGTPTSSLMSSPYRGGLRLYAVLGSVAHRNGQLATRSCLGEHLVGRRLVERLRQQRGGVHFD